MKSPKLSSVSAKTKWVRISSVDAIVDMAIPLPRGTLFDELFAATYHPEQRVDNPYPDPGGSRRAASQIRAALISSERYELTDDVVRAATDLGVQHPDILIAMLSRARQPFPKMWVEWDQRVALEHLDIQVAEDAPPITGSYLEQISAPGEFPVFKMTEMGLAYNLDPPRAAAHATSIIYSLDQPILERMPLLHQERSSLARFTGISKEVLDTCLLGSTYSQIDADMSKYLSLMESHSAQAHERKAMADHRLELCRKLAHHASHSLSSFWPSYTTMLSGSKAQLQEWEHVVKNSILEFSGTWRFLVSVLALIQARDYTAHVQPPRNPAKRRFVGNKVVPYLQHWRVSLKLPRQVILRDMITSMRESLPQPRRTIEGYWRSHHDADGTCDHVNVAETPNRYRCVLCKRALWFTPAHERGDSTIGYVKKNRVVEKRNL
jgi:hypothetical protein